MENATPAAGPIFLHPRRPPRAADADVAAIMAAPTVDPEALRAAGVEVRTATFGALGGGIGSFVWVDLLRVCGVPASEIAVAGSESRPGGRFQRLCDASQMQPQERLRSNSDARPDNPWGFPGYGAAEALRRLRRRDVAGSIGICWRLLAEPALAETYTPPLTDVFGGMEREARRIGWDTMQITGRIRAIRKTTDGRLMALLATDDDRRYVALSARVLHLALGYPAIRLLDDLAAYRDRTGDLEHAVSGYEEHEHVYQHLQRAGGTVLLRGRGIAAARILQRLWEERRAGASITVVHLHRTRLDAGHRYGRGRRRFEEQWEFQPFNWPKAAWGGEFRERLAGASPEERARLSAAWGGTTVPARADWRRMVDDGLRNGWYRPAFGPVTRLDRDAAGRLCATVATPDGGGSEIVADFVIDCTGVDADPARSRPVADLIRVYDLALNGIGRLVVDHAFELTALRHGNARLFAAGAMTAGNGFAPVDSFLGLQYAAQRSIEAIAALDPALLRPLHGLRSLRQWWRWARGVAP